MTHDDILKAKHKLDLEMLEKRKALNERHYYPKLSEIQLNCEKIGHEQGRYVAALVQDYYLCRYCGAIMKETIKSYDE